LDRYFADNLNLSGPFRRRNTGLRPVRQADILSAFRLAWKRSATLLGAQTWRSMFRNLPSPSRTGG